jgi:hypothetical protein
MIRLLVVAIFALTAVGFSAAVSQGLAEDDPHSHMTAKECEEYLDACASYCDKNFPNVNRRRDCIDSCNDRFNHCFSVSKPDPKKLQGAPAVSGQEIRKPPLDVPSVPIQRPSE